MSNPQRRRYGPYSFVPSREDKVLFPESGTTKGDLIDYYEAVAEHLLPHVADRPASLRRFPDGIGEEGFFQKAAQDYFPDWVDTVELDKEGGKITHVVITKAATLAYLADQAAIELHVGLSRIDRVRRPDLLVFDLDPPGDEFELVRRAAFRLRELLTSLELACYVKTTGSRGLHVVTPLRDVASFDDSRAFAHDVARLLAARHSDELTTEQRKDKRRGRLFLDTLRNAYGQTAVAPYSVRARPGAPVAVPVEWEELEDEGLGPRSFDLKTTPGRLRDRGDPWRHIRRHGRGLEGPRRRLERLRGEGEG